jgi:hypothetical protein
MITVTFRPDLTHSTRQVPTARSSTLLIPQVIESYVVTSKNKEQLKQKSPPPFFSVMRVKRACTVHCQKRIAIFHYPARMSLTKLYPAGNN